MAKAIFGTGRNEMKVPSSKFQVPRPRGERPIDHYPSSENVWALNDLPVIQPDSGKPQDLEERTAQFGETVIRLTQKIPRNPGNDRIIGQLVGCGTSIGANYCEASECVSKKDFRCIISRCVKEAKETRFFLRMVATAEPKLADEARMLYREARELHLIFASMYRK
jgi:four helix bundle protein